MEPSGHEGAERELVHILGLKVNHQGEQLRPVMTRRGPGSLYSRTRLFFQTIIITYSYYMYMSYMFI